jgi:hypothetical protein
MTTGTACGNISSGIDGVLKKEVPKAPVINEKGEITLYAQPSGTYTATIMGVECKVTFNHEKGRISNMEFYDKLSGKEAYEYMIKEENGLLYLYGKNRKTGEPHVFKNISIMSSMIPLS